MFALKTILDRYRTSSQSEREKGTYFERLIRCYFKNEPCYEDLFTDVWMYADWARKNGLPALDAGIDLVASTNTDELVAIQCKLYAEDHTLQKKDIDSFFTASGKTRFARRIIVSSTNQWSAPAEAALSDQRPPVTKIDLEDLEHSRIDWSKYQPFEETVPLRPRKTLREHQVAAVNDVLAGLATADRGKMIMACGTGKTFTSLKIAEKIAGRGGRVLFLVPSLSLLSQILTEWTQESEIPLHSFAVCSDSDVGKKRTTAGNDDDVQTLIHELKYPATTDAAALVRAMARVHDPGHMSVVFSTYHSIGVLGEAQRDHGLPAFDLIVCDEAHRTTGAIFEDEDESAFVRVHDGDFIHARKRLYMTATPRIYGDAAKVRAETESVALCSMDDPALYGPTLHTISFSRAVQLQLLVDYKVIVLAVEESHVSRRLQALLSDDDNQLKVTDAAKIVGCWKALGKRDLTQDLIGDAEPMRRAVAFCQVIRATGKAKYHQVASETIAAEFQAVVDAYQEQEENLPPAQRLSCQAAHVDGSMNAGTKEQKLRWLKEDAGDGVCRILSNVRCLSEGVDVPALDAVLFLTPRNSQVDVVQSVGRVMRLSPGKKRGYVILPVVIPAGLEPHEALADNKTYAVVWQVLQALRSHDDRFDAMVNKMDLELNRSMLDKIEVVAISDAFGRKTPAESAQQKHLRAARTGSAIGAREREQRYNTTRENQLDLDLHFGELERAIYARIVQKCGNRHHWEDWANDISAIARTHIDRITGILENPQHGREREAFQNFADELRDDLNDAISDAEVIEMLAQHLITRPVFDALFSGYSFAAQNPISQAMQAVLDALDEHRLDKEADTLEQFYESVRHRAAGIENAAGKQKIVVELYDKFFRNAFPRMTERLGIVYTPVEVVDFILHSVDALLRSEFQQTLGSPGVHILDPFTGTGTFITRLLTSGLIAPEELTHKYLHEIHANEIVLLAYYIAAINIESTFHSLMEDLTDCSPGLPSPRGYPGTTSPPSFSSYPGGVHDMMPRVGASRSDALPGVAEGAPPTAAAEGGGGYIPFPGICLTDTFQLYEKDDLISRLMVDNSDRRTRQKNLDIRVIIGNPPYSVGQGSENDNNQNVAYPGLDERIRKTYAERSKAVLSKGLYDSYIRALRWASDRIGTSGVIGFVTNAGFLEAPTFDGLRKCLAEEFSSIYVFHLRGNQRTSGEQSRKEGGKIFGSGSRAPIAISFLVKNPESAEHGKIYFHNIGDYLTREDKLAKIQDFGSIQGISHNNGWMEITPDSHGDWLRQRDDDFNQHIVLGDKKGQGLRLFENFTLGVVTNRDAWCYNPSKAGVAENMKRMIAFYNQEVDRFHTAHTGKDKKSLESLLDSSLDNDPTKISWTHNLKEELSKRRKFDFENACLTQSLYRPFSAQWVYYNRKFNERVYQLPRILPDSSAKNILIGTSAPSDRAKFSVIITDRLPSLHAADMVGSQYFPLYLYDEPEVAAATAAAEPDLFSTIQSPVPSPQSPPPERRRRSALTDAGLAHFQAAYPGENLSKEDIFYYVYGLLHSPDYRARYADNLSKELPRIPCVKSAADFWAFSRAGRALADLHINYETVDPYPATVTGHQNALSPEVFYRVEKMKYAKKGDKTTLIYNAYITISDIPLEAYDYIVNGKPALDWVVERQCVKTDKDSGIVNDANAWALETMHNPRYPLDLFLRVITVSLETMKLVNGLPGLEI